MADPVVFNAYLPLTPIFLIVSAFMRGAPAMIMGTHDTYFPRESVSACFGTPLTPRGATLLMKSLRSDKKRITSSERVAPKNSALKPRSLF